MNDVDDINEMKRRLSDTEEVRAAAALAGLSRREVLQRAGFSAITLLLVAGTEMGAPKTSLAAVPKPVFFQEEVGGTATDPARQQFPYYTDGPWDKPEYYQTIQAGYRNFPKTFQSADIDGDGRDEMIVRGPGGIHVNKYNPETGQWGSMAEPRALDKGGLWRDSYGWDQPQYYSTIQLADIDGDDKAELIGRGGQGIEIFKYDASATVPKWVKMLPPPNIIFSDASGWNKPQYYNTIQCADIDGDGKAELIGRGGQGLEAYKYDPSRDPALGWYALPRLTAWSDVPGNGLWTRPDHYTTIQCADIDGDGKAEVIGRGGVGVEVYKFDATLGWQAMPALP
ncbi:MAG: VCBS repeat-containing protein, partial [Armatimonadota bacterium]